MQHYEYRVIPAPAKGRKAPGVKGAEARFAHTLEQVINEMAASGWDYLRADILPSEERQGLTSTHTVYRSVLVFRRPLDTETADHGPRDSDLPKEPVATQVVEDARSVAEDIPDPNTPGDRDTPPDRLPWDTDTPEQPKRGQD